MTFDQVPPGLPFGLEPGNDGARIHPRFDDLEGHLPADRLLLFGHKDQPHAPFADRLHKLVHADDRAGTFTDRDVDRGQPTPRP